MLSLKFLWKCFLNSYTKQEYIPKKFDNFGIESE